MDSFPIQVIYGKRISGKSYLLLDLLDRIKDRSKYYFDSREKLGKENINWLIVNQNAAILIDTNVLNEDCFNYILNYDVEELRKKNIQFIISSNISKKSEAISISRANKKSYVKIYYLENNFKEEQSYPLLKSKMSFCNLRYFQAEKTILDELLAMQKQFAKKRFFDLSAFSIPKNDYKTIVYLLLLAYYGKVTSKDMVNFHLNSEPYELMPKLDCAVEEDYSYLITSPIEDNSTYQIVCNAQGWLLGFLSKLAVDDDYYKVIVDAFYHIAEVLEGLNNNKWKNDKELFKFIKFDNINSLFGGCHSRSTFLKVRKLIKQIYTVLKPILGEEYQFNHQHAKCLLWGIEECQEIQRNQDLDYSYRSINLCLQQIHDGIKNNPQNEFLQISLAHAEFTLAIIKVKMFYFNKKQETFEQAIIQLYKSLEYQENINARELFDESKDDEKDYSVSNFIDALISGKLFDSFNTQSYKKEIERIISARTQKMYNI